MSQALRKLVAAIGRSNTAVIFINQLREKIGIVFGNPEVTPGGRALKFYSSVRLDVRRLESIKVGTEVMEGCKPAQAILDYSRENGVDLIMLATHGRSGMKGLLMGSVAFRVLHESTVPVLLIRPEACRA